MRRSDLRPSAPTPIVYGSTVDDNTRCVHYNSILDIVALKCSCCERYYPCFACHLDDTGEAFVPWPSERFDEPSVLCGVCSGQMTAPEYLASDACPACNAAFNPGCKLHAPLYFEAA